MSQGAFSQMVWGFEETAGVAQPGQQAVTKYGLHVKNMQFTPKPTFERDSNIDPRGQLRKGRVGKWDLHFSFDTEPSVDDLARLRFHHQGMATITTVAAGVQSWALRDKISTDTPTVAPDWLTFEFDRDDNYAQLLLNGAIDQMDVKVAAGKIVSTKFSGTACRFTHMKDPAFTTTGGTYTGIMNVRGNRIDADAQDTTNHLKAKFTTGGALDGTALVKFTKGATAYGTPTTAVTAGVWYPVILADGTYAGSNLEPVEVMWTSGGTITINDEFTIQAQRPKATATYPSKNALIAVSAVVTVGGTAYPIENFDVMFKRPRKYRRATNSRYPAGILPDGTRSFGIKLKRDYVDRDLYLKMLSSTAVSFDITINGDFIATVSSVSYFEKWNLNSTNAQVLQAGADVPNDKQLPESIDIVPYWDGSSVDMTETLQGTLATLK